MIHEHQALCQHNRKKNSQISVKVSKIEIRTFLKLGFLTYCGEICMTIDHFTVVGLVTWPLNGSEAGVDLVLIQTSLLLLCKSSCSYAN